MYQDNKQFAKNEIKLQTQYVVRIFSEDAVMEFGQEKYAMLLKKSRKRHMTEGIKLPNQEKIRTLREKETNKYSGISELTPSNMWK